MCVSPKCGWFIVEWLENISREDSGWVEKLWMCRERADSEDASVEIILQPSRKRSIYPHTHCETVDDLYNQLIRTYYVYTFTIPGNCLENSLVICLSCPAHRLCERKHTYCTETLKTSKLRGTAHSRESQCLNQHVVTVQKAR